MSSPSYRPSLDGLRALAVYLVVAFHAQVTAASGGFVGVDLFFVLSGFLVTGVLLGDVDDTGRVRLGRFWSHRVRRLLPAAVLVVVATAGLQLLVLSQPAREVLVDDARSALLYVANWHALSSSHDYFAQDVDSSPFLHFWSLSIEEQFYVGYPLLVLLVVRLARRPVVALAGVLVAVLVASVGLQVWLGRTNADYAYYATQTRVYQLAAGALAMLVVRRCAARRRHVTERGAGLAAVVGLAALLLVASGLTSPSASSRGLLAAAASVVVVLGLWWAPRGPLARVLSLRVPRHLGRVSYGTYLWHWPVLLVVRRVLDVGPGALALLTAVVATGLAALSYELLEQPVRRTPRLASHPWPVTLVGVVAGVVVAALVVPQVLDSARRPDLAAVSADTSAATTLGDLGQPVPTDLDLLSASLDVGGQPPYCTPAAPTACDVTHGTGAHVLLVGDSQARMLVGAMASLAAEHDWTLSLATTPGCPWQEGQVNERSADPSVDADECLAQREAFYRDVLPAMHPDLVVLLGLSRSNPYWARHLGGGPGAPRHETLNQLQVRTTEDTVHRITATGARVVIVKSVFGTQGYGLDGFDPIECLASARVLGDCAVPVPLRHPHVDGVYDLLADTEPAVADIDVNPVICPRPPLCSPVDGDRVVWKDRDHVTAGYLDDHRGELLRLLERTGLVDLG